MKKGLCVMAVAFLMLVLCLNVYAHPGNTDADGGHIDERTGEYHYHHGYPAHQHYDIDGDGRKDCPYDFDDKTGQNSGSSSGTSTKTYHPSQTAPPTKTLQEEEYTMHPVIGFVLGAIGFVLFIRSSVLKADKRSVENELHRREQEISDIRNEYTDKIQRINDSHYQQIIKLEADFEKEKKIDRQEYAMKKRDLMHEIELKAKMSRVSNLELRDICEIAGADKYDSLSSDGLPVGDKYWFYYRDIELGRRRLHTQSCKHRENCLKINAVTIKHDMSRYVMCQYCRPKLPDTEWVDIAIGYIRFLNCLNIKKEEMESKEEETVKELTE